MIGIFWWFRRLVGLEALLGGSVAYLPHLGADLSAVAGWGRRPSYRAALRFSRKRGLPCLALEDGFLRSVGLGVDGHLPLSLVVDDLGIYYDATRPSRLERLIAEADQDAALLADARRAMRLIRTHRLSKYNHAPELCPPLPAGSPRVLVVDQTAGDLSVRFGGADEETFAAMITAALNENPDAAVLVKTHPDVLAGKKRGHLAQALSDARVSCIDADVNPMCLLEQVDRVYVATSQMGFEALMLGKPVVCFGLPWYAGWGLTDDRHPRIAELLSRRPGPRNLTQIFAAAYLQYARYIHPETREPGTIFDVIEHLVRAKQLNEETRGSFYCVGMSWWKRAAVTPFLSTPSARLRFVRSVDRLEGQALPPDARLVVWGRSRDAELAAFAQRRGRGLPVYRMEDGFLRSVGLGSDLRRPLSLVLDDIGIYYDARSPSRLEHWLEHGRPDRSQIQRARLLREKLVGLRLSKYNVGSGFALTADAAGKRVILVPGQVEDDASIRFGSPEIGSNLGLLETVRQGNPEAYIVFKPHPDVVAGNRRGTVPEDRLAALCDQVATDANIIDCIVLADELHTMTSLAGFEALLYGKTVHCYGLPFYAGWGLTRDRLRLPRRTRRLALGELVYGALIHYPRYIDPETLSLITVERVVELLERERRDAGAAPLRSSLPARQWRKLRELSRVLAGVG